LICIYNAVIRFPFVLFQLQVQQYLEKRCGVDEESAEEFRAMLDPVNGKYCPWPPIEWAEQEAALAAAASHAASDRASALPSDAANAAASAADPPASGQDEENRLRERSDDNAPYNAMFQ
jgi:hypothetical protein